MIISFNTLFHLSGVETKPTEQPSNKQASEKKKKERKVEGKRKIVFRMGGAKHCPGGYVSQTADPEMRME